jgi:tripartite ATP-independent transporter DctM subunit
LETIAAICILFILIIVGVPIAYSLGAASIIYVSLIPTIPNQVMVQRFVRGADSFELIAIPMFILAGSMLNATGATTRLVDFANALVGHFRGGLAQANIVASMLFAGMSGSANADVAGIGRVEIKMMMDQGYDPAYSAAITASSSCIGPIIPPSTTFIIYGAIAMVPIGELLVAGALPGVLMGLLMMVPTYFIAKKRNYPKMDNFSLQRLIKTTKDSWLILLAPVIIVGGVLSGVFTATEAGVVALFYALVIGLFVYRTITLRGLIEVLRETVLSMSMVMFLLATGLAFSWVLSAERVPYLLIEFVAGLTDNPTLMLFFIGVLFILLGMFFSVTTNLIMAVPVLMPLVNELGINGVQFGVVCVLGLTIGCVTPPVGAPMYLACQFANVSIGEFFRANRWYYLSLLFSFLMVILFPQISLFLPNLMK